MKISLIVATAKDGCIGKNNNIPWHLPADLKYFKGVTTPHHVIMGRKCYESIPEKYRPLPNRTNIIITRQKGYQAPKAIVVHSLEEALSIAQFNDETEAFVIGGGEIYALAMPQVDTMYITEVDIDVEDGEVFFPIVDETIWELSGKEAHHKDEKNKYNYTFKVYNRKPNK
ncbi:UNVERIFIED_CONTAM: hypothetical protein GTU68_001683 [Idotea baltica]|nr:hypothetical protein [Idotea baltica]